MVDIFGKKKQEERIKDLESRLAEIQKENEDLIRTLEKRDGKIRKLSRACQDASIALKATKQKSASEQALIEPRLNESIDSAQAIRLKPREMEQLISKLQGIKSPANDLITARFANNVNLPVEASKLSKSIKSSRGWIFLQCPQLFSLLIVPPLPVKEDYVCDSSSFDIDFMGAMLDTPLLIVSSHAGDSFLGFALSKDNFQAQELIRSPIKEKHSKGGWSQKRFERLREEDIKNHAEVVIERLKEFLGNYRSLAQMVVLAGDPVVINQILPFVDLPVIERRLEKHDEK
ncbi:MAG: hypothetical protein MUO26_01910, partial [Methanotrichaceae archaeon]|nr:hypothetical protein [Methanotrichaceae archaeon]